MKSDSATYLSLLNVVYAWFPEPSLCPSSGDSFKSHRTMAGVLGYGNLKQRKVRSNTHNYVNTKETFYLHIVAEEQNLELEKVSFY